MSETLEVYENKVHEGKNKHTIKCKKCNSSILLPCLGVLVNMEFPLPKEIQIKDTTTPAVDQLNVYWLIGDMFTFENVAFSHQVNDKKYLNCADCEAGPIGFHDLITKISYIAPSRVDHVTV